jgi:phosphopantothenoylcysteine decarboxylase/phosphopantothenate--cysteine ligase
VLRDRVIVVGVSGGIAAYKACELVRRLRDRGAAVIVAMTPAACEFVTPLTFQALSGNPVITTLWGNQRPQFELPLESRKKVGGRVEHVDVAEVADCLVIAPATADLMARMVHGEAPDALTCLVLASSAPLVLAPAMDLKMWRAEPTRANVRALRALGARIVDPATGFLASGLSGPGRLADIADIVDAVERAVTRRESMKGVRVLVGAGRTEEALDPVRVLTNRSSGRMGFAIAEAARDRGADVTVVAGPVSVEPPHGVSLVSVTTALEMQAAMQDAAGAAHVVVMAAAVADYRAAKPSREKLKRSPGTATLALTPNPDILAGLGAARRAGQVIVGFALETNDGLVHARAKRRKKSADLIVLNSPADGIGTATNQVTLVSATDAVELPKSDKREIAEAILDRALALRKPSPKGAAAKPARRAPRPRKGRAR